MSTRGCKQRKRLSPKAQPHLVTGVGLVLTAMLGAGSARPVFAQSLAQSITQTEEAEAMIRKGLELRHQGQEAQSVPYLEKAYKLSRTPRTAAQLGLVRMALGYWVDAERYLDEALADPDNPWIAKNRETLESARKRVRGLVVDLTITGEPAGAEVVINGIMIGALPLAAPVHLSKGRVEVEVRAPGYLTASKALSLAGGAAESVSLVLQRTARAPGVASRSAGETSAIPLGKTAAGASPMAADEDLGPKPTASAPTARDAAAGARSPGGRATLRRYAWGAAGAAVAGLAVGVVETVVAQNKLDAFNSHASPSPSDPAMKIQDCMTNNLTSDCKAISDAYHSAKTGAVVGYVVGGALAVTSAVLFVLSSQAGGGGAGAATALGCAPVPMTAGLTCGFRF